MEIHIKEKYLNKQKVFETLLREFETDEIRDYCADMIETIPDYIFTIPSSTSLKYHNKTQCETHGQIYHILMFGQIMNYILGLKYVQEKYPKPRQRDCLRCVPIFHDAIKCGLNGSLYSVHDHPMLAGEWVRNTKVEHDIKQGLKDYIAACCESHSGEWTSSKRSKVILPEPQTDDQFLCHLCDYLSSRSNLDMTYMNEVYEALEYFAPKLPDINTYVLPFGRHNGETLVQIAESDPSYITWLKENIRKEPIKSLLKQLGD